MKMNMNTSLFLFNLTLTSANLMILSSNNWFFSWIMIELCLFSIIPVISTSKKMSNQLMKFFIIQSTSSSLMLTSLILNSLSTINTITMSLLILSTSMKMGMAPLHNWMITLFSSLSWTSCFLMATIQKFPPSILFTQMIPIKSSLMILCSSIVISCFLSIKQTLLKKFISISSINTTPWLIMSIYISKSLFLIYSITYSLIMLMMTTTAEKKNTISIKQMTFMSIKEKLMIQFCMFSIMGLPPTTGFIPKLIILQTVIKINFFMSIIMIISSTIMMLSFMKFSSINFSINSEKKKMSTKLKTGNEEILLNNTLLFSALLTMI